ncbi:type II toxin-antitoxin system VapC family toxin [Corynebacterium sp. AOP34-AQ2-28]|uniref:type II toxin-antitoxin system VapC family toxin n=1 Tax=Corynebacterium sp. AOP34-AQ2-28 TaxID=3457689 RepID=UPI004033A9A9
MSTRKDLPYALMDTCCIFDLLIGNDDHDKAQRVEDLLEEHGKSVEIIVPVLVRLEVFDVLRVKCGGPSPESWGTAVKVAEDFFASSTFLPVELDDHVGDIAEGLISKRGVRDKDAVVLASAIAHSIPTIYTFDKQMMRISEDCDGVEAIEPNPPTRLSFPT